MFICIEAPVQIVINATSDLIGVKSGKCPADSSVRAIRRNKMFYDESSITSAVGWFP